MSDEPSILSEGYFGPYSSYANTLRAWFVAFGVGGPALLITNSELMTSMKSQNVTGEIGILFSVGVAAQVAMAFINKILMWYIYAGEGDDSFKLTCRYRFSDKVTKYFFPDIVCDLISIVTFAWASVLIYRAVVQTTVV